MKNKTFFYLHVSSVHSAEVTISVKNALPTSYQEPPLIVTIVNLNEVQR